MLRRDTTSYLHVAIMPQRLLWVVTLVKITIVLLIVTIFSQMPHYSPDGRSTPLEDAKSKSANGAYLGALLVL